MLGRERAFSKSSQGHGLGAGQALGNRLKNRSSILMIKGNLFLTIGDNGPYFQNGVTQVSHKLFHMSLKALLNEFLSPL